MLRFYNTDGRKIEDFKTIEPNKVKMYCCGPTVYNYAHIGNLRTYIFEDLLKKTLKRAGYQVKHVMNITDVGHLTSDLDSGEDKMLVAAEREQKNVIELARFYENAFMKDCASLNIERPDVVCRATEYVPEMIEFIQGLEKKGYTYVAGGNVYFDSSKFKDYGKMAHLDLDNLLHGYRVEEDPNKKNPTDSVLWFTNSKYKGHILSWKSPWGEYGYPGWNIECSAMALKNLGERLDIHCGGVDHINVHHTNEIAQSEALLGHKWVNTWMHGEFLQLKDAKMSKSKGGFLTLSSLVDKGYDPLHYRYLCLTAHYRSRLTFSFESLDSAKIAYENICNMGASLLDESRKENQNSNESRANLYLNKFNQNLYNDLNSPQAIAVLWSMLKDKDLSAKAKLNTLFDMDIVLGLNLKESIEKRHLQQNAEISLSDEVQVLLTDRVIARREKNWKKSDEIRSILLEKYGLEIKDLLNDKYELKKKANTEINTTSMKGLSERER